MSRLDTIIGLIQNDELFDADLSDRLSSIETEVSAAISQLENAGQQALADQLAYLDFSDVGSLSTYIAGAQGNITDNLALMANGDVAEAFGPLLSGRSILSSLDSITSNIQAGDFEAISSSIGRLGDITPGITSSISNATSAIAGAETMAALRTKAMTIMSMFDNPNTMAVISAVASEDLLNSLMSFEDIIPNLDDAQESAENLIDEATGIFSDFGFTDSGDEPAD